MSSDDSKINDRTKAEAMYTERRARHIRRRNERVDQGPCDAADASR